jgi:hypothetical protein
MRALAFLLLSIGLLAADPALAQRRNAPKVTLKPDQIRGVYVAPKDAKFTAMYNQLREQRVLEQLSELLSPIKLPRPLTLKIEGCDGVANAWYEEDAVTICYEYLDFIVQSAPKGNGPKGATQKSALVGPLIDVTLHEVGHAVFDMLQIPVFGREEDAADQFSAYIILNFAPIEARSLIRSIAYLGAKEAKDSMAKGTDIKAFADSHGLPTQRYFNTLCTAYGSNPRVYRDAITRGELTEDRAEGCEYEYEMLERAFDKLIRPYIDQPLLRKVRLKTLFGFADNAKPADVR